MRNPRGQRGFTLIELMVVVSIIGLLMALAIPKFRLHVVESRLHGALPYMLEIAAKQRMYFTQQGKYCCTTDNFNEDLLNQGLGLSVNDTGDFCFVFVCRDAALCENATTTSFIAPSETGDPTVEFEVWAVLRKTSTTTVSGPYSSLCTMSASKRPPTDWVEASTSPEPGREGQVIVSRYPPPPNGADSVVGDRSLNYVWNEGISLTHALQP